MITIKDNTKPDPKDRKIVPAYVSDVPRFAGLFHALDMRKALVSRFAELDPIGLIHQLTVCNCIKGGHLKPAARCAYVKFFNWFITVRYW